MGALQRLDGSTRVMLSELICSNRRRASDELWQVVEPLLPPEPDRSKGGRPRVPTTMVGVQIGRRPTASC
jgi:hypothetical protein